MNGRRVMAAQKIQMYSTVTRKMELVCRSIRSNYIKNLLTGMQKGNNLNADTLCDFIFAEQTQYNPKLSILEWKVKNLCWLSRFFEHVSFPP